MIIISILLSTHSRETTNITSTHAGASCCWRLLLYPGRLLLRGCRGPGGGLVRSGVMNEWLLWCRGCDRYPGWRNRLFLRWWLTLDQPSSLVLVWKRTLLGYWMWFFRIPELWSISRMLWFRILFPKCPRGWTPAAIFFLCGGGG